MGDKIIDIVKNRLPKPGLKIDRTRHRFVAAIRSELALTGLFTADTVAKRAKTSPATFYNHFSSKDVALASAFEAAMDELLAMVNSGLQIEHLLQQGLTEFCAEWAQVCAEFFSSNATLLAVVQAEAPASEELRRIFASRQHESLVRYERFIELGQLAQVIRAGDINVMAKLLLINNQSWNHPFLRQVKPSDALYQEMTHMMVQLLAPKMTTQ
jgi:AcrR family transcriptional regulator